MKKFHVGQKVRQIWAHSEKQHLVGRIGVVVKPPYKDSYFTEGLAVQVDFNGQIWYECPTALAPLKKTGDFAKFMKRVLKPVQLDEPVTA